jgi:predicted nucleic acid-binding protein
MKVVSNTLVLIGLSTIGQLDLLHTRFPEGLLIPEAVWREVVQEGGGRTGAREVATADWIRVQRIQARSLIPLLQTDLDEGEAEAIVLAQEVTADMVLLDERDARRVARRLGLQVVGTVGLLVEAKRLGRLINLREQLDALQTQGKFRLSRQLYERALREGGE